LDDLIKKIHSDQIQRQYNKAYEAFSISIFSTDASGEGKSTSEINSHFIHSQLLIDCLIGMKSNSTDKIELISLCKKEYEGNNEELKILEEFEQNYSPIDALWWYTRQSFLYRLLNKALRVQNIDLLYLFRFFIRDIEQQLEDNKCSSSIRVYRGQLMSKDEVEILKNGRGKFISINSFLSTLLDRNLAMFFIRGSDISNDLERVFFEIDADPQLKNIKPFSNITSYSHFSNEKEVLFMIGSIFQLVHVDCDQNGIWIVRMNLCTSNNRQLKSLLEHLKSEYDDGENNLISFGDVLLKMDKFNDAQKYYQRCVQELSSNLKSIARCYHSRGVVAMRKNNLDSSLKWLNKSLQIKLQAFKSDDLTVAENYNSIGIAYQKKGDLDQAIKMFEKSLVIWKKALGDKCLQVAECYSAIGNIYQRKKMFSKALEYHRKALDINEIILPEYHTNVGISHISIANVHRYLEDYVRALKHANLAFEILQKSLPSQDSSIGWVFETIGLVYEKQGKLQESLSYLNKALDTYQQTLPITHYYITDVEKNIQRVSSQLE
jgi:tetratricopeptide (TPR) repeat protein